MSTEVLVVAVQSWFCHPPIPRVSRPGSCRGHVPWSFPRDFLKGCRGLGKVRGSSVPS